jgi:peptidoglycan/LPS O-acetylase OafA/YrhL
MVAMAEENPGSFPYSDTVTRLPWIDGLKGLAILGIVLYHVALALFGVPPFDHPKDYWLPLADRFAKLQPLSYDSPISFLLINALRYLSWLGYQGVNLFLVLSGFGLTWSVVRRLSAEHGNINLNWTQFYQRRLWRIFPLYWAGHVLFLVTFVLVRQPPQIAPVDGRFYLSLAAVRFLPETFFYIAPAWWYVGLIWQLYLVFPVLWVWLHRKGLLHFWVGTAAITLVSRYVLLVLVGHHTEMWSMGALFVTRLFEFSFGMGLAYCLARQPDGLERFRQNNRLLLAALPVYLLALALSFTVVGAVFAQSLITVSLFGILLFLYQRVLMPVRPLSRLTGWLGVQSYGLMILHQPVLWGFIFWGVDRFQPFGLFLALLGVFLILTVLSSAFFGAVVERISGFVAQTATALLRNAETRSTGRDVRYKA